MSRTIVIVVSECICSHMPKIAETIDDVYVRSNILPFCWAQRN